MTTLCRCAPPRRMEDWLRESIACDISRRLTGTTIVTCRGFGRYGADLDPNPAQDLWIQLAKRLVEMDDDVPLARLCECTFANHDIRGPETVKGWALLQFLFEWDAAKARAFVRTALAQGTPKAADAVYEIPMDEIDARYRECLRLTW